ncbi:glycosyltransferase involved in cell wall biosynthesis [Paucibacter oligotrophus]|uniref:Glycosyltransferase involved in cell wall biosynthesis n=1 Tax=Roseateles oligotrophus TaxID=1769250 RepID=A0A840LA97_9BURK|nr:glycosyltransferase [Roseateles oligotrophus]MBB4842297.1 glycosyltransferase involved in cell wall biosynthesis [Roseateles oligotrophus]
MNIRLLFLMYDYLPAFRPDVTVLFGKELKQLGIGTDLLGQVSGAKSLVEAKAWPAGEIFVYGRQRDGLLGQILRPLHDVALLFRLKPKHDVIQVRDKIRTGLLALGVARLTGRKMTYWMSFPFAEGFKLRAQQVGASQGLANQLFYRLRAAFAGHIYYRCLAPRVDHLFVQSEAMLDFMASKGVARSKMTAVPMGVDLALFAAGQCVVPRPPQLLGRKVLAYMGSLGQSRQSGFLLEVLRRVRVQEPTAILLLAGDGPSADERAWVRQAIVDSGLADHVWLTGWLPQAEGLALLRHADVGLSPIPRGVLFDVSSPTKAAEYLALGLPCVGNDIPDQKLVLEQSAAGLCVDMDAQAFADACLQVLQNADLAASLRAKGPPWVAANRSYQVLAHSVAAVYRSLVRD